MDITVVHGSLWAMEKNRDRQTVKLPTPVMDRARELSGLASKHGWAAFGVDRDDPPTMTAIFDEATRLMAARLKVKGSK
jgi:hypothetical protein